MTKKLLGLTCAGFIMIFSFQNCQKVPLANDVAALPSVAQLNNSKIDLKDEKLNQVDFVITEKETVTRGSHTFDLMVNKTLQISLSSGVFQVVSDLGEGLVPYCLTESLRHELLSILKSSQICIAPDEPAGQVCAQVIKLPYAQILTDIDQYDLGSATDSCGSGAQDLCGSQADMLKGYVAALKTQYKSLSCP
ncbi:MAG: hypothetical protein H7328_13040 [Bdellovibrio sp.]|nr:hypothetical protein [Bdellovibrio sp.]